MGSKPPYPRSADVTYSWNTRWRRDLDTFEKRLNDQLPPGRFEPMDVGDLKSLGRGAGALMVLGLVSDYMNQEITRREQDIDGRVKEIAGQVKEQLQPGQEVQVHIAVNRASETRVSTVSIEPVRNYPQLRATDGSPQRIWQASVNKDTTTDSTIISIQVRKPRDQEDIQCLVSELSSNQSVTTKFRISERNETLEVRHLSIPDSALAAGEVPKEAPQKPFERPLLESERRTFEERAMAMKSEAEAAARAEKTHREKHADSDSDRSIP